MRGSKKLQLGLGVGSLLVVGILALLPVSYGYRTRHAGTPSGPLAHLPSGEQTYSIAQAAEVWPKIVQATINPPDVHVGDTQVIEAVVESRGPITAVFADIETDNGTERLELGYVGIAERAPDPFVGVLAGHDVSQLQRASADDVIRGRYRGSWVVHDTHNTTYHTTITAEAGEDSSSVVMAWSDACGIPQGGDATLGGKGCTISSPDGVDNGNLTVDAALTLNANFAFNSGKQISVVSGGSIAICNGCALIQTNIYQVDADGDGYPADASMILSNIPPGNGERRRYLLQTDIDCNDNVYSANNTCGSEPTMVAYYTFDDIMPWVVSDSSGYGNDGYPQIGNRVDGYSGDAFVFLGDSMYVPDNASLQLTGDMSINFWWNNSMDGSQTMDQYHAFTKGNIDSGAVEYHIRVQAGLRVADYGGDPAGWGIDGESNDGSGNWDHWLSPNDRLLTADGNWHMITVVRENGNGKVYEDGALWYSYSGSGGTLSASQENLVVGDNAEPPKKAHLYIDELRIYNGALSDADVVNLWNDYGGGNGAGGIDL